MYEERFYTASSLHNALLVLYDLNHLKVLGKVDAITAMHQPPSRMIRAGLPIPG